jgi:uncharacterized repeat protein (TIGR01451 family)
MAARVVAWLARFAVLALAAFGIANGAHAQVTTRYTNTLDSATNGINETATPCTSPFTRAFSVGTNYIVADVTLGVLMAHTYRGDLVINLVAPDGTRIELMRDVGTSRDNVNVLHDDAAANPIANHTASNDTATSTTVVPTYQRTFRPANPLSGFDGKASLGTWTLEICDQYAQDSGTFFQADLFLTSPGANTADLSLTKVLVGAAPTSGSNATWRLSVTNSSASGAAATGVSVTDILPAGFVFVSASGTGTYTPATGIWSVGSIPVGATRTIDITGTVNASAGAVIVNTAEITAASPADPDSTVGNGATGEDDYASAQFTVAGARVAGTPPTLTCPAGTVLFDWDVQTWAAGSTSNSYALSTLGNIGFTLTNPGTWLNSATLGGQSPNLQNVVNGGVIGQNTLIQLVDLPDRAARVVTTITLPKVMQGAQFRIYDLDFGANQFADIVTVEGSLAGSPVTPTLTNGVANYTIANSAYGDGVANNDSADGTMVATFTSAIDTITIRYGNHSAAPANPGQQAIALADITFCHPITTVGVTKTSVVLSDPQNGTTNPKAIPGAVVEYCVTVTNSGTVGATTVIATDTLPAGMTYVAGSLTTGATCATATTAEDDNNTGADESNPHGASFATGTAIGIAPSLAAGQTFAFKLQARID